MASSVHVRSRTSTRLCAASRPSQRHGSRSPGLGNPPFRRFGERDVSREHWLHCRARDLEVHLSWFKTRIRPVLQRVGEPHYAAQNVTIRRVRRSVVDQQSKLAQALDSCGDNDLALLDAVRGVAARCGDVPHAVRGAGRPL